MDQQMRYTYLRFAYFCFMSRLFYKMSILMFQAHQHHQSTQDMTLWVLHLSIVHSRSDSHRFMRLSCLATRIVDMFHSYLKYDLTYSQS